jgi:alpha-mannosidase
LILRFYEFAGQKTAARITLPPGVEEVWDANLMEQPGEKLSTDGKTISAAVNPYEIKTLRLHFRAPAASESHGPFSSRGHPRPVLREPALTP